MKRVVVNVATTDTYRKGQTRLSEELRRQNTPLSAWGSEPPGCPKHADVPYAMKSYALKDAAKSSDLLLWCDSSILPIRSLEPLWRRIELGGYWFSKNGWNNYEWTADSAYEELFATEDLTGCGDDERPAIEHFRELNRTIPHVVATAFGLNVRHPKGKAFLDEYYRLASETRAFCGPWINLTNGVSNDPRTQPCGPVDVRGHRHDQTAASVIAWRLGFELTDPPDIFAYGTAQYAHDERTILLADGSVFN